MNNRPAPSTPPASPSRIRSETSRPSLFWLLASVLIPPLAAVARYRILSPEKLPRQGACVVAPNHNTEIDPVIIGALLWKLHRAPRFLTKASLFRIPVVGWILRSTGQVPVERVGSGRSAAPLLAAGAMARQGQTVIVYPEGTLTRDPDLWPMRGKTGAARIALEQGIPVIPVAHWGGQQILPRYSKKVSLFPRKTITVAIGDPVDLSAFAGRPVDQSTLTEATALIMKDITGLLESIRGEKAPDERWNPAEHNQNETGRF